MRISWNWLRTLIDTDALSPREAADLLTSTGLEVESVELAETVPGMLAGVVVGEVLTCSKHPDADRLQVCSVDIGGEEPSQIVCGAPNVAAGQKVLVATVGTTLHPAGGEPFTIKKAKIRGVESHGMICAADELGLGTDHAGIMVLDASAKVGTPAADQLQLKSDHAIEIGLTPNRSDALGHWGVARDLIAALNHRTGAKAKLLLPSVEAFKQDDDARTTPVEVLAPDAAPRYAGLTITNLTVGPSPAWLQERLKSIGLKPINNVVDITNFVQHELGQPLHAFDADKLKDGKIVVRKAKAGERIITLDEKDRTLSTEDLLIADAEGGACLAGVYGGIDSGVSEGTTAIFLESACFDAVTIRRTARRHGLNTDASFRFERGVDPEITVYALKRAALLLKEVAGAKVSSAIIDIAQPRKWAEVQLHFATVDRLCGVAIAPDDVVRILEMLDCRISDRTAEKMHVAIPPYRVDVLREADLVEEVLRIHGFDRVPIPERLMMPAVQQPETTEEGFRRNLAQHLASRGFREVMTPSLVNGAHTVKLKAAEEEALVRLKNPLSAELDVMRPTMLFGLLQGAAHNLARQQHDLRFFEKGRVYTTANGKVIEEERIALLITGKRWRESWRSVDRKTELADVKEELELLLTRMGLGKGTAYAVSEYPLLASAVEVKHGKKVIARIGEVAPNVLKAFDVGQPAWYAEIHDETLVALLRGSRSTYREVSKFPSVRRDLSLLLDRSVAYAQLEQIAYQAERKLLRAVDLFDVYEGDKLPAGKKSYALSFILQDNERTLTDEMVDKAMGRIRSAMEKEVGAELRG
ncbi:MAG: phenylalanine--tRNA ligase subunit beta [Flavobacteriales bacterium]|jgi:phenylalanyl-tRNA synthetase beta chain|nr:phenylalanine--tRNA ligase subunit beta [Flavobacteriales bacterium]MCB0758975.1 phenylalanine--tRNA ligase subunit beta [Flavobacteriales bacterium]